MRDIRDIQETSGLDTFVSARLSARLLRHERRTSTSYISALLVLISGAVSGCTRTAVPSYYILTQSAPQTTDQAPESLSGVSVGIGPVRLPGRLDRPLIVTRVGGVGIKMHSFHRWGDTLQRQIEEGVALRLGATLGDARVMAYPWERVHRPDYQVLITVRTFEGELTGQVTLDATWRVVALNRDEMRLARRFRGRVPVEAGPRAEQLPSYVRAMSALTDQLAQEILRGLIKLGKPTSRRAVEEARSHADDSERDDPR